MKIYLHCLRCFLFAHRNYLSRYYLNNFSEWPWYSVPVGSLRAVNLHAIVPPAAAARSCWLHPSLRTRRSGWWARGSRRDCSRPPRPRPPPSGCRSPPSPRSSSAAYYHPCPVATASSTSHRQLWGQRSGRSEKQKHSSANFWSTYTVEWYIKLHFYPVLVEPFFSFKEFGGHQSFLWGRWCPCFGLLVMSVLGAKVRVPLLWCFFAYVHWINSPLVWHLLTFCSMLSMAAKPIWYTCLQTLAAFAPGIEWAASHCKLWSTIIQHSGTLNFAFVSVWVDPYDLFTLDVCVCVNVTV